jgi:hypothetical protein
MPIEKPSHRISKKQVLLRAYVNPIGDLGSHRSGPGLLCIPDNVLFAEFFQNR